MTTRATEGRLRFGLLVLVICVAYVLLASVGMFADSWSYYFANPEMGRDVCAVEHPQGTVREPRMLHDFDGDGTADEFEVEYFHLTPLCGSGTSGLLRVRSGSDGSELLVRGIPTPIDTVIWTGDLDGNGTDDLFVANTFTPVCLLHAR